MNPDLEIPEFLRRTPGSAASIQQAGEEKAMKSQETQDAAEKSAAVDQAMQDSLHAMTATRENAEAENMEKLTLAQKHEMLEKLCVQRDAAVKAISALKKSIQKDIGAM